MQLGSALVFSHIGQQLWETVRTSLTLLQPHSWTVGFIFLTQKRQFLCPVCCDQHSPSLWYMTRQLQLFECYGFYEKYPTEFMSLRIWMTANTVLKDCETSWHGKTLADSYHKHRSRGLYSAGFWSSSLFLDPQQRLGWGFPAQEDF